MVDHLCLHLECAFHFLVFVRSALFVSWHSFAFAHLTSCFFSFPFRSNHFTDFVLLRLDKKGIDIAIGPTSALAVLYSLSLLHSLAVFAILAWALGGCFKKGTRMTFFQLLACGFVAFMRMTDVSARLALSRGFFLFFLFLPSSAGLPLELL